MHINNSQGTHTFELDDVRGRSSSPVTGSVEPNNFCIYLVKFMLYVQIIILESSNLKELKFRIHKL